MLWEEEYHFGIQCLFYGNRASFPERAKQDIKNVITKCQKKYTKAKDTAMTIAQNMQLSHKDEKPTARSYAMLQANIHLGKDVFVDVIKTNCLERYTTVVSFTWLKCFVLMRKYEF